ncbi:MAG: chemotaxis protein CheD [Clostridiaceae bacterium]
MIKVIGIGEYEVSHNEEDIIKTYALGSCVAVVIYSPMLKKLGMVHIALPDSRINKNENNTSKIGYFADTALPKLFNEICGGYSFNKKYYKVSLFGGALSRRKDDIFNVGLKNIVKIESILNENGIEFDSSNTGGYYSRTVEVDVRTGTIIIDRQQMKI